ncbi:hypothetical protein FQN57_003748 [Myotisia sp. PD_48]|nr:hypothetical protein FQN57_003748 [Myotisia sp. PD_48]
MHPFSVFARWRPLTDSESALPVLDAKCDQVNDKSNFSISLAFPAKARDRPWASSAVFSHIFNQHDKNKTVFETVVSPSLNHVLKGKTCNFFAYGHSGSGKSHTIIGYNYDDPDEFGLCLAAAGHLSASLDSLNSQITSPSEKLGIGIRMYELRKNIAFDLLNGHSECHIREGPDGRTHIRGKTETLENGKVRVRPIITKPCWSFEDIRRELLVGLKLRATGSSSVHDQSSRTHAVLELEIVTKAVLDARDAVIERQSELVPVGKLATDIYLEENSKAYIKNAEGKYVENPNYKIDQERINVAEAKKAEYEGHVREAEEYVTKVSESCHFQCLGGKLVFVDLAGSEYYHDKTISQISRPEQTPQEQQEGRQINTDLLALKEVIRAQAEKKKRIPFRSSPLTMVLREHFIGLDGLNKTHSAMILTVSPSSEQYAATLNTLKYGNLMGVAGMK